MRSLKKSIPDPDLADLYQKVPPVPCFAGCKGCCVSPTMTMVEFIYLFNWLIENYSREQLEEWVMRPMKVHPQFEGNYYCRLQSEEGLCMGHGGRALACRMHGLPVIEKLKIQNLENCEIMDKQFLPDIPAEKAKSWLQLLVDLNRELKPDYDTSFFGLPAFNLEGWLDICFQENVSNESWKELKEILKTHLKDFKLSEKYIPLSELSDKMEYIALLELSIKFTDGKSALESLKQLKSKFPSTGSYFHSELEWMLGKLNNPED